MAGAGGVRGYRHKLGEGSAAPALGTSPCRPAKTHMSPCTACNLPSACIRSHEFPKKCFPGGKTRTSHQYKPRDGKSFKMKTQNPLHTLSSEEEPHGLDELAVCLKPPETAARYTWVCNSPGAQRRDLAEDILAWDNTGTTGEEKLPICKILVPFGGPKDCLPVCMST